MNPAMRHSIGQLDSHISNLRATLSDLRIALMNNENGRCDFAQLHEKANLEREIQQKRTFLYLLLQDEPQPWYFYLLPPEMQVEICKWITDPQDQLNLLQLFPSLGPLMHWDEGTLYFTLMYPLIRPYLYEWRDFWRLCQVCPAFMEVVLTHFDLDLWRRKYWIPTYRTIFDESDVTGLLTNCNELGRAPWMADMPFLCVIDLWFLDPTAHTLINLYVQFLAAHGEKVRGLRLYVNNHSNISYPWLHETLAATPNLVHLELISWNHWNPAPPLPHNFPELPQLRYLETEGPYTVPFAEKYATTLKSLKPWSVPLFPQNVRMPQLEIYDIGDRFHEFQDGFPNSILMCPLRCIHLALMSTDATSSIPNILETFTHFQNTLEELKVYYHPEVLRNSPVFMVAAADKRWMLRVNLPKLHLLHLINYRGTLDWLILFPSLSTLILENYSQERHLDLLKLPYRLPSTAYSTTTNAFAYLPKLQEIKFGYGWEKYMVRRDGRVVITLRY